MTYGEKIASYTASTVVLLITLGLFGSCAHSKQVRLKMIEVGVPSGEVYCLTKMLTSSADRVVCDRVFNEWMP